MSLKQFLINKFLNRTPVNVSEAIEVEKVKTTDLLKKVDSYTSPVEVRGKAILNEDQQMELVELISRFATKGEITEHFYSNYKIIVSAVLVNHYKRATKWRPIIKKFRDKYLLNEEDIGGSHKRIRLDRAEKIFEKTYDADNFSLSLQANRDMQEMKEGKSASFGATNLTYNQYNVLDDEELRERIAEAQSKLSRKTADKTIDVKQEEKQ